MVVHAMPYKVTAFGISDIGLVRQNNEDYWAELPKQHFFVLADGMGGHRAGEVAAREAVKGLCGIVEKATDDETDELSLEEMHGVMQFAIEYVNELIYTMGSGNEDLRGMGTTLCCLFFHPQGIVYAHVGDSRIYRFRDGTLEQITKDDSLLRELIDLGQLSGHQAGEFAYKNIITKAIGTEPSVEPSVHITDVADHDVYLMCSDGLSDMLKCEEIESIIKANHDVKKAVKALIAAAKEKGGYDNITVILMKVKETNEKKDISR